MYISGFEDSVENVVRIKFDIFHWKSWWVYDRFLLIEMKMYIDIS